MCVTKLMHQLNAGHKCVGKYILGKIYSGKKIDRTKIDL